MRCVAPVDLDVQVVQVDIVADIPPEVCIIHASMNNVSISSL